MAGRLIHRRAIVTVARSSKDRFFETREEQVIEGLRVVFDVEKNLHSQPNTCRITIYNLTEESQAMFQRKPASVRLDVGYEDEVAQLFRGDVRHAWPIRETVDLGFAVEVGDGERAHRHARVNKSYGPGTDVRQVIKDATESMNLKFPTTIGEAKQLLEQFSGGVALHGPTSRELTRILEPRGMSWSVQDGQLQILDGNNPRPGEALIISEDTGMIGSPERGVPSKKGGKQPLRVNMLLRPEMRPGTKVIVKSRDLNGPFKIESAKHTGDTHGEDWTTTVELKAL